MTPKEKLFNVAIVFSLYRLQHEAEIQRSFTILSDNCNRIEKLFLFIGQTFFH